MSESVVEVNKYQGSKLYKIISNLSDDIYIGSTCEKYLSNRLGKHRSDYKRYLEGKESYTSSYELLKLSHYEIILIENYPCNNKDELKARESYWIKQLDCVNKNIPGRTHKQWLDDNKVHCKEYAKEHYEKNKVTVATTHSKYYEKNKEHISAQKAQICICECGRQYTHGKRARHMKTAYHIAHS